MKYKLIILFLISNTANAIKLRDGDDTVDVDTSEMTDAEKKKNEERKFAEVNKLMSQYD